MEFHNIKPTSIYDIIHNAYDNHYDVVLSLDSIVSQFFSIFQMCEKERVFGDITSKKNIVVYVDYVMSRKQLEELPHSFIDKIDLSVFGLEKYTSGFVEIMSKFSVATVIFELAGMSERLEYTAHTLCRNPDITIDAEEKRVREVLGVMYMFCKIPVAKEMNWSQKNKYKMITKYVELIRKVYEAQYKNNKDADYFYNLIQENNSSGGPVSGTITAMESAPTHVQLNVKRTSAGKRFPDLIYQSKLITKQKNNILFWDVVAQIPDKDTTI